MCPTISKISFFFLPRWVGGNKNMRLLAVETSGRERYPMLGWFLFAARLDAAALPPSA